MVVSGKLVKRSLNLVHRLEKSGNIPLGLQTKALQGLLKKAEHTAFGKEYKFSALLKSGNIIENFQKTVPVFDYDSLFNEWWNRTLAGESDVCWRGKVKYFALSSGTTGDSSKYIPVTTDMTRAMRRAAFKMFAHLPKYDFPEDLYLKEWLMVGGSAALKDLGHCFAGDLSGINARKPPFWIRRFYRPGTKIAKIANWDERVKEIAKQAPKWDVAVITGVPSWVQLTLEYIIDYHHLNDIHELWPNLSVFVSGGIAFEPYRRSLEKLFGKQVIYQDSYLASEGFIAFQARPETNAMKMVLNNGIFYEFIPFNDENFDENGKLKPNPFALTINEVKEDIDYALLLSNCSGAWRYLIGDTIRFKDIEKTEIIITGRTKHFLSICGEHLSVDNMNQAIIMVEDQFKITIQEFIVCGVKSGSHYAHKWYIGCSSQVDEQVLIIHLDQALKKVNDDYDAERNAMLAEPQIKVLPPAVFYNWQKESGKTSGQSKIPRVIKGEQLKQWESFLASKGY